MSEMPDLFHGDAIIEEITDDEDISKPEFDSLKSEADQKISTLNSEDKKTVVSAKSKETKLFEPDATYIEDTDDINDEDLEETLAERLWGLTEMFPEPVRNVTWKLGTTSVSCAKGLFHLSRSVFWIISTSAIILAVPTLIETEKSQLEELNRQQQRQILLGPSASLSGSPNLTPSIASPR